MGILPWHVVAHAHIDKFRLGLHHTPAGDLQQPEYPSPARAPVPNMEISGRTGEEAGRSLVKAATGFPARKLKAPGKRGRTAGPRLKSGSEEGAKCSRKGSSHQFRPIDERNYPGNAPEVRRAD